MGYREKFSHTVDNPHMLNILIFNFEKEKSQKKQI